MSILDNLARLGRASMQQKERAYSKEAPELGGIFDNPASLLDKYVQDGTQNFKSAAADPREYAERSNTAMAGDVLGSMATGAVNATLGGAKLAAQTGDDTGILGTFRDFNNWVGDQKSDALKANLEDKAQYDANVDAQIDALVANGEMTQGEAEWKRLKSKIGSYNMLTAGDTGAAALGSALPIIATRGALRGTAISASGASALAETADNVADELYAKDPLGKYVLSHDALMDSNKDYAYTYQKTGSEKAARDAVYVEASNQAATDPAAIAASAFEMFADSLLPGAKAIPNSVKRSLIGSVVNSAIKQPVKNAAKTIATEMPSEVTGSAGRRISSNRAAEEAGLGERDILQGVGSDTAEAIVGSIGSGGAPAMSRAIQVSKAIAGTTAAVGSAVFGKGENTETAKPSLSTKANDAFKAAAEPLQAAQAEVDAMPEGDAKTERAALLESIGKELIWEDIPEGAAPESIRSTLNGSAHKAEAVDKAVQGILEGKHTPFEVANLLAFIQEATGSLEALSQQLDNGQLDIEDDSNILGAIESFRSIRDVIQNDENVSKGMEAAHSLIANIDATIDQNKPMAEQQEQINNLLAKVQVAPETLDEASVSFAIDNATELSLDNNQVEKLKFIRDALGLQRELDQYNADQGHNKAIDIVSREVKSDLDKGSKGLSVMGHADRVMSLARSGNTDGAKEQLTQLANFAKSQLNKLNALKASQKSGNAETYKTVGSGMNKFADSKTGVTYSAPVFADTIQAEAQFLTTIYNQLAEAFPELGMPILPVPAKFEHNIAKPKSKGQATPTPKADSGTTAVNDIINTANNPVEEVVEAAAKHAASLSDEELNDVLNSMDPKDPAFAAYDNEMNRREDAAQEQNEIEQREEQVLEPKQVPVSLEEPIEGEVTVMRKGKPHVYTKRGGKVFNSKDKEIIDPRIIKLFDPVVEEVAEPVVKEDSLEDLVNTPERVKPSKLKANPAEEAVAEAVDKTSSTPATPELPYKKVVWNGVVAYDAFDGMKPGDWKVFENGFEDSRAFNYLSPSSQKIAGDFEIIGNQIINFNITSETGKGGATGPVLKVVMKNLFSDFPQATRLHGFRISGMRNNNPEVSEVNFKIENGRLIAIRKPSTVPGGSTSQSQQESQIPQGVENNTPRKSSPSSLVPIEAAVDSVKKVAPLVAELDRVEQSIKNTTDEATLIELEEKAEDLYETIPKKVDEIINELIAQLDNMPSLVADGIRDELNDLKESEEEPKVKLRELADILRLARKISNSTEDMFEDTSSVTTSQSQQPPSSTPTFDGLPVKDPETLTISANITAEEILNPESPEVIEEVDATVDEAAAALPNMVKTTFGKLVDVVKDSSLIHATLSGMRTVYEAMVGSDNDTVKAYAKVFGNMRRDHKALLAGLNKTFLAEISGIKFDKATGYTKNEYDKLQANKANMSREEYDAAYRALQFNVARRYDKRQLLNLYEYDPATHTLTMPDEVMAAATAAIVQYTAAFANEIPSYTNPEDVAKAFGIDLSLTMDDGLPLALYIRSQGGVTGRMAKERLAALAMEFLGVRIKGDSRIGQVDGAMQSLMATLMADMIKENGYFDTIKVPIQVPNDKGVLINSSVTVLVPNQGFKDSKFGQELNSNPDLMKNLLLQNRERPRYIGVLPKVTRKKMRSLTGKINKRQQDIIEFNQKIPFFRNSDMMDVYTEMFTEEGLLELFGNPEANDPDSPMNVYDRIAKEGNNNQISGAFNDLIVLSQEIKDHADGSGISVDDVPVYYSSAFTSVSRLQMGGAYNPQGNKTVRSVMSPNKSQVDLSNFESKINSGDTNLTDHELFYALAMAQALGIKVHNNTHEQTIEQLGKLLKGKLKPAIDMWAERKGTKLSSADLQLLKDTLGGDLSNLAIQVINEHTQLQSSKDKSKFTTYNYIEADGITNGPFIAGLILGADVGSPAWVEYMANGGLYIGQDINSNEYRSKEIAEKRLPDNYLLTAQKGNENVNQVFKEDLSSGWPEEFETHALYMHNLMTNVFGHITVDPTTGDIIMSRNTSKKPMTVTIYGSGVRGVAGKFAEEVVSLVHEISTATLKYGKDAPQHLYPELTKEEAELKFKTVRNALIEATSRVNVIYKDKSGQMKAFTADNGYGLDIARAGVNTTVSPKQLETLTANLQRYLAAPLVKGARSVSGRVMDNSETLAKASNIHSGLIQVVFLVELQNMLNDLVTESKTGTKDVRLKDFLTPNEIIGLHKQMEEYGVSIEALGQIFSLAKTSKGSVQGINLETGQGANGEFASSSPSIENPTQLGVGGVPRVVHGFGDGAVTMSFLEAIRKSGVSSKLLQVFDGINLSADNFREGSKLANEAVMKAVMSDPLTAISDSLSAGIPKLLIKLGLVELGIDGQFTPTEVAQGTWEGINKHLGNSAVGTEILFKIANPHTNLKVDVKTPAEFVTEALVQMNLLADVAKVNKQNQKVLADKLWSIDQMAAVGEQGTNKGEKLGNTTNVGVALELAAALNEANKPKPSGGYKKPVVLEVESGFKDKKQTRSLFKELLATVDGLTDSDRNLFTRILVSSEKAGVKVFTGTSEEINKDHIQFPASANGAYNHGTNTVYLSKVDLTTLMHELTHGVTTATLIEYFTGDRNKISKEAQLAIQNLDKLLDQFLAGFDVDTREQDVTQKQYIEYIKTTAIRAHAQGGNRLGRAKAISEMIAIVATDKEMREVAKKAKNNTQLARIVGSIVDVAKAILGLPKTRGSGFDLHTSFFDAVYTNTTIIMDFQTNQSATAKVTAETDFSIDSDPQGIIKDTLVNVVGSMETVLERDRAEASIQESGNIARETGDAAMAAGFKMDQSQIDAFEAAHTLLGAAIPMDADIRSGINKLVRQAIKELKPEDFLRTKNPTDTDIMDAESKYNYVTGSTSKRNKQGRSSLVPTFVALSMTNKEFAEVLGKLKTKAVANNGKTIDESLSKFGYSAMNRLSNSVNKIDKAKNIPDNLKSMYGELLKKIEGDHTKYDAFVIPVGNAVDKANAILSDGLGKIGKALNEQGNAMKDTDSKAATAFGTLLSITGAIIDKESAGAVAEGLTSLLNKTNIPSGIKYTIREMIGRTGSSARIYDLIKPIRSFVQKQRQMYVDGTPINIIKNFTKAPTAEQWSDLTNSMAKTGLGLLANMHGIDAALNLIGSDGALTTRLNAVRKELRLAQPELYQQMEAKADQLATYMNTGVTGGNLLRNAYEIAGLFGTNKAMLPDTDTVKIIDELATLKALKGTNLTTLRQLAKSEAKGIRYTLSFLQGQIKEESKKGSDITGGFKGYIPVTTKGSVVVISDKEAAEYTAKGYVRIGDYVGSRLDKDRSKRGYYYSPLDSSRPFAQGIIQNVLLTKNGVNLDNGYAVNGSTVGSVTLDDDAAIKALQARMNNDPTKYGLIPIYALDGTLQGYERAIDPAMQSKLKINNNLAEMLGVWRGRQSEEFTANQFNRVIVDELMTSYKEASDKSDFVDILNKDYLATNPVLADAVKVMSKDVKEYANELGGKLFVRKDMIENVTGYRSMTVANIFDGITGMNPELREAIKDGLEVMMGKKAYYYLVRGDEILRGLVGDVKQLIVVKSVVVPAINAISNIVHMIGRGVPVKSIAVGMKSKLVEIETYSEMTKRLIEIESDMRANTGNLPKIKALQAERTIINETISGLSIYPLIQAGEFSSIVSVQIDSESNNLRQGKIAEYMESQIAKLNPLGQDVAKNLLITKDTSIYQFLQKATDYGDFIAKAIIYDDIIKRKGGTKKEALIAIKEEFINYDYLPGRVRGSLEGMGLLWFYNFKLRSVKIALSMIRENPLHTLLAAGIPSATPFGNIGLPINDNVFYKLGEGTMPSSIGPSQGLGSWKLHPWINITN